MPDTGTSDGDMFAFDLASVETYLVAGQVWKLAPIDLSWYPISAHLLQGDADADPLEEDREAPLDGDRERAELRARELGLPLAWPDRHGEAVPRAMRTATLAAEEGRGGTFMLAAARLAFAGGYNLDWDPDLLLDAASVAGLNPREAMLAADDHSRDPLFEEHAARLRSLGINRLPALRLSGELALGERAIDELIGSGCG
ncbi:MAG TPA: DsbA family protein [Solirubrobacteraceae bacterium]|nr:DsbA family protein [Solirubrobacteraceae bacterium]